MSDVLGLLFCFVFLKQSHIRNADALSKLKILKEEHLLFDVLISDG